jgi:hypothetical protein
MPVPELEGVHEKLIRAEAHFDSLYAECQAFIERDPQPWGISIPYYDPDSDWYVCCAVVNEPAPPRLGVILGDVIHNARSALEHLVWQLVIANGEIPKRGSRGNTWPIVHSQDKWAKALAGALNGVGPKQQAVIALGQPYRAGIHAKQTSPAIIQALSNTDKHQLVHVTRARMIDPGDGITFTVRKGPGTIVRSEVTHGGRFEDRVEILRTRVEGRTDDTEVWMEGGGPLEVAFGEDLITITQVHTAVAWVKTAIRDIESSLTDA